MGNLQIVLVQKPESQSVWCEDKNYPLRILDWMCETCGENALFAHPEEIDEAVANPKAHWDNLEDKKARERGVETPHQGQSTLGECMPEYWRGSAERKHCVANLTQLCSVENLPLHIGT